MITKQERGKLVKEKIENEGNNNDQPVIKKVEFDKMYKGPKHYFPGGDVFNYNFDHCKVHQPKKEALNKELTLRKDKITRSLKTLF